MIKTENQVETTLDNNSIESALNIKTISTKNAIADKFQHPYWTTDQAFMFLGGIFKEDTDENGVEYLETLEGVIYSEKNDKEIYDAFMEKCERIFDLWGTIPNTKDKYSRGFFIRWALKYPGICDLTWLNDAIYKGYYKPAPPKSNEAPKSLSEKPLNKKTENCYLRLIYSLSKLVPNLDPAHHEAAAALIVKKTGCQVKEGTIAQYIKQANELEK